MHTKTVEKVVKHSFVYGYAMTQPFLLHVDVQSQIEDWFLSETDALTYGENSEIVRHFQHKLTKLGYYEDTVDGMYGLLTENAVKGFQSSHEIEVNGQADEETMEALLYKEKKKKFSAIKETIDAIDYGEESENVKEVQELLLYYGYYDGEIDGIYGSLTENALTQIEVEGLLQTNSNQIPHSTEDAEQVVQSSTEIDETNVEESADKNAEKNTDNIRHVETTNNSTSIIQEAKNHIGTSYVWGGTSPQGFDCSGFIQFVYQEENITIPRTVREIWNFASPTSAPSVGDLVFFETYQAGPSHMGIYLGNGDFIHAGTSNGVTVSNLHQSDYWKNKYIGSKRI